MASYSNSSMAVVDHKIVVIKAFSKVLKIMDNNLSLICLLEVMDRTLEVVIIIKAPVIISKM